MLRLFADAIKWKNKIIKKFRRINLFMNLLVVGALHKAELFITSSHMMNLSLPTFTIFI